MKKILGEKSYLNLFFHMAMLFIVCVLAGIFLLFAIYSLPTGEMKANVRRSSSLFDYEGVYPQIVTGYKSSQLDNYTDTLMLASAIYPGSGNNIKDAMLVKRIEYDNLSMPLSLTSFANDVVADYYEAGYPRYWHGYLVFLKPLLLFLDFGDIRMLNMICQMVLIFTVIALIWERAGKKYAAAFLITVILLNPVVMPLSLQYSSIFYIMMLTLLLIWKQPAILQGKNRIFYYLLLFFIVGMASSYFDLFTYPIVTLGLPLTSLLVLEENISGKINGKQQIQTIVLAAVFWGCGYVGMWGAKFIVGSVLAGENILAEALARTSFYVSADGGDIPLISSLPGSFIRSLRVLLKWPYILMGETVRKLA